MPDNAQKFLNDLDKKLWNAAVHKHAVLGLSKIGAGLAGGDCPTIAILLEEELSGWGLHHHRISYK